jgi:hypothetical protein
VTAIFRLFVLCLLGAGSFQSVQASVRGRLFIWLEGEIYLLKVVYLGDAAQSLDGLDSVADFTAGLAPGGLTGAVLDHKSERGIAIYVAALRKHFLRWAKAQGIYKAGSDPEFARVAWNSWMKSTHFLVLEKHDPAKAIPTPPPEDATSNWRIPATLQHEWGFAGEPVAAFAIQSMPHAELTDFEKYFGIKMPRDLPEPSGSSAIPSLFWVPHKYTSERYYGGSAWVHGLFIKKEKVNQFIFQSMLRASVGLGLFGHSFLVPKGEILQTTKGPIEGPVSVMPSRIYSFCWDPRTSALHQMHCFQEMADVVGRRPPSINYLQFLQLNVQDLAIESVFLGQKTAQSMKRDIFFIDRVIRNQEGVETSWSLEHPLETLAALQFLLRLPDGEFTLQSQRVTELSTHLPAHLAQFLKWSYSTVASARLNPNHPLHLVPSEVKLFLPGSVVVPAESCSQKILSQKSLLGFRMSPQGGDYVSPEK